MINEQEEMDAKVARDIADQLKREAELRRRLDVEKDEMLARKIHEKVAVGGGGKKQPRPQEPPDHSFPPPPRNHPKPVQQQQLPSRPPSLHHASPYIAHSPPPSGQAAAAASMEQPDLHYASLELNSPKRPPPQSMFSNGARNPSANIYQEILHPPAPARNFHRYDEDEEGYTNINLHSHTPEKKQPVFPNTRNGSVADTVDSIRQYDIPYDGDYSYQMPPPPSLNDITGHSQPSRYNNGCNNKPVHHPSEAYKFPNNITPEDDFRNNSNFNKNSPEKIVHPPSLASASNGAYSKASRTPINYNAYDDDDIEEGLAQPLPSNHMAQLNQIGLPASSAGIGATSTSASSAQSSFDQGGSSASGSRYANNAFNQGPSSSHHHGIQNPHLYQNHHPHHAQIQQQQQHQQQQLQKQQPPAHHSRNSPAHSKTGSYDKTDRIRALKDLGLPVDEIHEIDKRLEQELKDEELARKLQDALADELDQEAIDRRVAMEAQDKELAKMLQERERAKARRAREKARLKKEMQRQQQQQQQSQDNPDEEGEEGARSADDQEPTSLETGSGDPDRDSYSNPIDMLQNAQQLASSVANSGKRYVGPPAQSPDHSAGPVHKAQGSISSHGSGTGNSHHYQNAQQSSPNEDSYSNPIDMIRQQKSAPNLKLSANVQRLVENGRKDDDIYVLPVSEEGRNPQRPNHLEMRGIPNRSSGSRSQYTEDNIATRIDPTYNVAGTSPGNVTSMNTSSISTPPDILEFSDPGSSSPVPPYMPIQGTRRNNAADNKKRKSKERCAQQ
ncbi:probable serine/threonine-protein kinase DDB_G0280133 isoform X2 [Uranotaenia lowii]|nr:probable serine/threonine-protein kinase DDB_G0280133 isoform X2 [Uranotaenia lowii]